MDDNIIEVFVTNKSKDNPDKVMGEWVELPTNHIEMQSVLERLGIYGEPYETHFITDYETKIKGLAPLLPVYGNLDELNYLAVKLSGLGAEEIQQYEAAIALRNYGGSPGFLINMTDNLERFEFLSGINNDEVLGYYYLEDSGRYDTDTVERISEYIDHVSFGRDERINEKGIYALGGYVHEKGEQPFLAKYQDMSDIPDYYRITSPPELPDPQTDFKEMFEYGYTNLVMLPLYTERALDLYDKNTEIYLLYEDNTEAAAETREEIEKFDGLLGIETEAWDNYKARENTYTICQLKDDQSTRAYRFEPYDRIKAVGRVVDHWNYNRIYTAPLTPEITADEIFQKFNIDRPADFKGHSLSVSDVIVFNRDGNETAVYVDTFGFKDVPEFFHLENPLETAEKSTEQNYNQIDGIINNQPSEGEREATEKSKAKPSIKDQLKENMAQQRKAAPEKKDKNKAKAPELEV